MSVNPLVSRLPPELLSLIFCCVRRSFASNLDNANGSLEYLFQLEWSCEVKEWMKISHVCHVWREVAMNTASLWSTLVVTRSIYKWAEECLRRSRQSSLMVFADFEQGNKQHSPTGFLRELRNHVGRCRVLCLRLTTGDLIDLLSQTDTPRLVNFYYSHLSDPESPESLPPLIDDSILRADSLLRLSITNCPVDWSSSRRRLTHLRLHYIPQESRLNFNAFMAFLLGIPSLELLDLRNILQEGNSDASHQKGGRIRLPNLKHLVIEENPLDVIAFLSSLIISPFCRVFVNTEGYPVDTTAQGFLPVFWWAHSHFHPPLSGSSHVSDTHHNYWRSLRIFHLAYMFGFQGYTVDGNLETNTALFEHCIQLPDDADHDYYIDNLPRQLFTSLPISHIVYLEIASYGSESVLSQSMWIDIFGSISTLESICIESYSVPFFEALSRHPNVSGVVPFPVLSSVMVRGDDDLELNPILIGLGWRFQFGVPLRTLIIEACGPVPPCVLGLLRKVVGQVTVRGRDLDRFAKMDESCSRDIDLI